MDGSGGRHVGPPRTIDVQQFTAARANEVQALCSALSARQAKLSSSGHASSLSTDRHLRRRSASHNRRRLFHWTRNAGQAQKKNTSSVVQSNASSSVAAGADAGNRESSQKRRLEMRTPSRRVRRRMELQGLRDGSKCFKRDGTRRLPTHVWHAKRFSMTKVWGYCLAEGLSGRGRGSDSVFKWAKDAAVLHDASYMGVIELQGTFDAIIGTLRIAVEPLPTLSTSATERQDEELHGLLYGNAVLHKVGIFPHEVIAPVSILWRPPTNGEKSVATDSETFSRRDLDAGLDGEKRQVWIWVHPSAYDSAFQALSTACAMQAEDAKGYARCHSRRGELARLDIFGSRALQVLQKVLRPLTRDLAGMDSSQEKAVRESGKGQPYSDAVERLNWRIFARADSLPMKAVLALDVDDPRDTPSGFFSTEFDRLLENDGSDGITEVQCDTQLASSDSLEEEIVSMETEHVKGKRGGISHLRSWENLIEGGLFNKVSDSPSLWSAKSENECAKLAPLSQKALSDRRHKERKANIGKINSNIVENISETGPLMRRKKRSCPVLLLRRVHSKLSASGWSLIMPTAWVHAFWVPLVFAGGHVIGLRELHWLATDAGIPYFPHDFPDCAAHSQHLLAKSTEFESLNMRRPPSKRFPSYTVSPLEMSALRVHCYEQFFSERAGMCSGNAGKADIVELSRLNASLHDFGSCDSNFTSPVSPRRGPCGGDVRDQEIGNDVGISGGFMTKFGTPSSILSHRADPVIEHTSLLGDIPTVETGPSTVVITSGEASQVQQKLSRASENRHHKDESCSLGAEVYIHETGVSMPHEVFYTEGFEKGIVLTASTVAGYKPCEPSEKSPKKDLCLGLDLNKKSRMGPGWPTLSFFVARTIESLLQVVKDSYMPYSLLLRPGLIGKSGVQGCLKQGRLKWLASNVLLDESADLRTSKRISSMASSHLRDCYVRVLVVVPRKGVLQESGLLCSPTKEDCDAFLSRSQHWQGIEMSWTDLRSSEFNKPKGKGNSRWERANLSPSAAHDGADGVDGFNTLLYHVRHEDCLNRRTVGFITSTGPHGSSWSGIGICEAGALLKLRAMQWADQRWWKKKEVLLLAGNKSSTKLRPVLVTIVLEGGQDHVAW